MSISKKPFLNEKESCIHLESFWLRVRSDEAIGVRRTELEGLYMESYTSASTARGFDRR